MNLDLELYQNEKVMVFIIATEFRLPLYNLLQNLKMQGYSYQVLQFQEEWKGWKTKWEGYIKGAKMLQEKEITTNFKYTCVCLDAYDTVAIRPAKEFLLEIKKLNVNSKLICGLENLCNPKNCGNIEEYWNENGTPNNLEKRYLNAGICIGETDDIIETYEWLLNKSNCADDQVALAKYVSRYPERIYMDAHSKIIKNKKFYEELSFEEKDGKGAYFLHFPGPSSYSYEHIKALKYFGGKFVINMPDYHYLCKKTLQGLKDNWYFVLLVCLILYYLYI
jgi:hypothetical protein